MVHISTVNIVTTLLLVTNSMAQSTSADAFASLVSEGYSLFTEVTSILPSVASAASAAAASSSASVASVASNDASTTTGSSSSTSTSSVSSTSSSSSASAASASSAVASASRSSASVAAASATAASSSHHSGGHNNLAIILGTVLGALVLGLLILALILCCRRRRRRSRDSLRSHALSPSADEVESWRQPGTFNHQHGSHNKEVLGAGAVGAPLMTEHPAYRDEHGDQHRNPFVPVPPPPRRSAQNSRVGLTDGTVRGDAPYLTDDKTGQPLSRRSNDSHHVAGALAAGAGGAALGAAAMHHHNKNKEHEFDEKHDYDQGYPQDRSSMINRKPVPLNTTGAHDSNVYPTTTTNDDAFALSRPGRRSMDSAHGRPSRDPARANAAFDRQYSSSPDNQNHHLGTGAALGAGALGGAALAHHRKKSHSQSPHRHALLSSKDHAENSDSSNGREYSDALPQQLHNVPIGQSYPPYDGALARDVPSGPYDISAPGYDVPSTPPMRSRRNSALGTAAPPAAAAAYIAHPHSRSRSRSRSTSMGRGMIPPAVPNRSPHRTSLSGSPHRASLTASQLRHSGAPEYDDDRTPRGVVGDNGYPHMGVPRRKSGGADDYGAMPAPVSSTVDGSRYPAHMAESNETSDDSTWRLSQGMPGGWQRSSSPAQRYNRDSNRISSPISPVDGNGWNQRDSLMSGSTAVAGGGRGGGRLRLADLRREEEEKARLEGRESMGSEWAGNGGYGGYEGGYGSHHGVGWAL